MSRSRRCSSATPPCRSTRCYINSLSAGLSTEITSFRHAVMILGLKKLFRWAALLLTMSREGGMPPALGQMAIVRGRLMELLAAELLPQEECERLVTGSFAADTMLPAFRADYVRRRIDCPRRLRTVVPWHGTHPELTVACETADDANFARLAHELTLSNHQINWAHLQAPAWAETMGA